MELNSLQDLKCLKPKEVLEKEEKTERRKNLSIKAFKTAGDICNIIKGYYNRMSNYNFWKDNPKSNVVKPNKPKIKELEIVYNYIEKYGLKYISSKNTENDEIFFASELTKVLQERQSKYIGKSLSSFKSFVKKFI